MINYQPYINALRSCAKEHENDITPFAHIIISDLCRDTANLLEELEQEQKTNVLNKIRAEIDLETRVEVQHYTNANAIIDAVLDVIENNMTEIESQERSE